MSTEKIMENKDNWGAIKEKRHSKEIYAYNIVLVIENLFVLNRECEKINLNNEGLLED